MNKMNTQSKCEGANIIAPLKPFKLKKRSIKRTYRLDVYVPPFDELVWDVINSIEKRELYVADPNDNTCLIERFNENGELLIDSDSTLSVPLADWLAVGCQRIRWHLDCGDEPIPDTVCGIYKSNVPTVLGAPYSDTEPAHELVHVFDVLKYLVPAFINWQTFWQNVLNTGSRCDVLVARMAVKRLFIDDYGNKNEFASIEEWWPSRARKWFGAREYLSLVTEANEK